MSARVTERLRRLSPFLVLGVAFAILVIYAYPGYTSSDSAVQLSQAHSGQYSDGHPPLVAAVWGLIDHVIAGPFGMLLIQGCAFISGLYLIFRRVFTPLGAAIATFVFFLFPVVFPTLGVIWKDSQMAAFLMLGIGLITSERPWVRALAIVSIAYGMGVRHNAPVAGLPLIVLLWPGSAGRRLLARLAIAAGVWMVAVAIPLTINAHLVKMEDHSWPGSIAPADIVGILHNTKHTYTDEQLAKILEGTPLFVHTGIQQHTRGFYTPEFYWPVMTGDLRVFDFPQNAAQRDAITRAWKELVRAEPRAWFHHRYRVFRAMLGYGRISYPLISAPIWHVHESIDQVDLSANDPAIQRAIQHVLDGLENHTPIYMPLIYFLAAGVLLPFARKHRSALALLLSGLLYELTFLPLSPSSEWRYSHWMICSTLLAATLLVRARQQRAVEPAAAV